MLENDMKVVRGGLVLDVRARKAEHADIIIQGNKIVEVGPPGCDAPEGAFLIDATDRLVTPGFINSHTHGHGSLGKGLGDRWSLELLLNASPWISGKYLLDDLRLGAELNAAEMILKGCTSAYDMCFEFPSPSFEGMSAVGAGYKALGVRVTLAPMMADMTLFQAIPGLLDALPELHRSRVEAMHVSDANTHLSNCAALLDAWPFDRAYVAPALGPTIPLHCSDDFIKGCRDLSSDYEVGIQMHLAESKVQAVSGLMRYQKTLTAYLEDMGLLSPRFTAAHGIWLDTDDLKRLSDHGATIAHNPASNLRLGSGIAPAREMVALGVGVGLGTDGSVSSDNQNIFEAMRAAAYVSRITSPTPDEWFGSWDVIEMATLGGAKVLGKQHQIGSLEPGYLADMVFLDLGSVNFIPLNDAANQIVHSEDSSAVKSVMIDGRMVLHDKRFTNYDFASLRARVKGAVARLGEINISTKQECEAMANYVSHHCVGLACKHYPVNRVIMS